MIQQTISWKIRYSVCVKDGLSSSIAVVLASVLQWYLQVTVTRNQRAITSQAASPLSHHLRRNNCSFNDSNAVADGCPQSELSTRK